MNAEPLKPEIKSQVKALMDRGVKYTIRFRRAKRERPATWIAKLSPPKEHKYGQGFGATPTAAAAAALKAWDKVPTAPDGRVTIGDGPEGEEPHE